jgi:PKD repeat protein
MMNHLRATTRTLLKPADPEITTPMASRRGHISCRRRGPASQARRHIAAWALGLLAGTGLTFGQIAVSPGSYDFGGVGDGITNQTTFVVTNTGSAAVTNGTAAMETGGSPFTITSNATFNLAGFRSTNVVVRFVPTSVGWFTNNVIFVTDNGGNSTNQVTGHEQVTLIWTNGDGNFSDGTKWNTGTAPAKGDVTYFTNGISYTVAFPAPALISTNIVTGSGTVTYDIGTNTWTIGNGFIIGGIGNTGAVYLAGGSNVVSGGLIIGYTPYLTNDYTGDITNAVIASASVGTFVVTNGLVRADSTIVGYTNGAIGTLIISNSGVFTTTGTMTVGQSSSNTLVINGGTCDVNGNFTFGNGADANGNLLQIYNGGRLTCHNLGTIAAGGSAAYNTCLVFGASSLLSNAASFSLNGSSGNAMIFSNGARFVNSGTVNIGGSTSSSNLLQIGGLGAPVTASIAVVKLGNNAAANNETVIVTNALVNCGSFNFGGYANSAYILAGATWNGGGNRIGVSGLTQGAYSNIIIVNQGVVTNVTVLDGGTGCYNNGIIVTNGGKIVNDGSKIPSVGGNGANAVDNYMIVTGPGSLYDVRGFDLRIGWSYGCTGNWLWVENGGVVSNIGNFNLGGGAGGLGFGAGNFAIITNGSMLSANGNSHIGDQDINDFVQVTDGSRLSIAGSVFVGASNGASGALYVGGVGVGSSVTVSNINLGVGEAQQNTIVVTNGELTAWNLNVGDTNLLTSQNTVIIGTGGSVVLLSTGTTVFADDMAYAHDGNRLDMQGGILAASGGISNAGALAGYGTIAGDTTIANTGGRDPEFLPSNSVGQLTFSNSLTLGSNTATTVQLGTNYYTTVVGGNLTLDGSLSISDSGGFTNGTYTLLRYGGTLITNGTPTILTISNDYPYVPDTNWTYTVDISSPGNVTLHVGSSNDTAVANFTGSPTNGAAPLNVTFTDTSSGTISNWFWDLGDGTTNNSAEPIFSHSYAAGTYTVILTVIGDGGSNTLTRTGYIVVTNPPPPVAQFSGSQTSGAAPLSVTFTNTSTGNITNGFWTLGDGSTSNTMATSLTHVYAAGTNTVSLKVSGYGGTNTLTRTDYIVVTNPPVPVACFSPSKTNGPTALAVTFTNCATGNITNWFWNFGDGITANLTSGINTSHTYSVTNSLGLTNTATYTVSQTVMGYGGSNNFTMSITAGCRPYANFSADPATGMLLSVNFTDLSYGGECTNARWTFGDNTTNYLACGSNPSHTYTNTGAYTVTLTDYGIWGTGTMTRTSYIKIYPDTETWTNANASGNWATAASWSPVGVPYTGAAVIFGTAGTTSLVNTVGCTVGSITFNRDADFFVSSFGGTNLTINNGITVVSNHTYTISAPVVLGGTNVWSVATGGALQVTDTVSGTNSISEIGGGLLVLSGSNTYYGGTTVSNSTLLVDNTVGSGTGTGAVNVIGGAVLGGNGVIEGPVTLTNAGTLSPGSGGVGTLTVSNELVLGSASVLQYELGSNSDLTVVSSNLTLDGTLNITDAGGFTNSTYTLFSYGGTLSTNGSVAILTITNVPDTNLFYTVDISSNGSVNLLVTTNPPPPVARFSGSPTNGEAPLTVTFTNTSSGNIANEFWDFGDGNTSNTMVTSLGHVYGTAATYTVSLTVGGLGGSDSITNYIVVTNPPPPVADFSGNPTTGAVPSTVTFTDSSTGSISNRCWIFGDGNTNNFATATNPVHIYNTAGTNTVILTVSGLGGSDSMTKSNYIVVLCPPVLEVSPVSRDYGTLTVGQSSNQTFLVINTGCMSLTGTAVSAGPFAVSTGSPYNVPSGQTGTVTVAFTPSSGGYFTNNVVFASSGGVSTNQVTGIGLTQGNIVVTPATNNVGTIAVGTTNEANFTVTNTGGTAVTNGTAAMVTSNTPFSVVSNATFSVAGFGSTNVVVEFRPVTAGAFTNNVAFNTANGGDRTNMVIGAGAITPAANFTGSPTNGEAQLAVTFTNASSGTITNALWSFGDTATTNTMAASVVHTYNVAGTNTVSLTVFGPLGTNTLTRTDYIVVTNPPPPVAGFSASGTNGVATFSVTFTNSSTGNITNWFWNFGDSTTNFTVATNPVHPYTAAGTNTVSLTVSGLGGSDSMTKSNYIVVFCPPQLVVSPGSLTFGSVTVGQTNSLNLSVINTGCVSLTGTATVATGPFAVSTGSPYNVSPGQTGTVTVAFAPVSAGSFTNDVIFASNGGVSTNQVTGIGLTPGNITVTPANYDFPNTTIGMTTQTTFVVTNTGGTAVTNGTASMVTSNSPFSVVSNATFSVAGFGSTNVVVQFAPVDYGVFTNNVAFVTANGGTSTNQVTGSAGTPPCISVTPATYDFGPITTGTATQTTFVVTNTGSAAVTNGAATMVTSNSPFSVVSNATFSVAGFGSTNVVVTFEPGVAGAFTNNVAFGGGNGCVSTNQVTGIGLTPCNITVTPTSYDFSTITTGMTKQATLVVTNTGGTAVTNGTASMVITSSPFSIVSGSPFSLAGFGAANVVVQFVPSTQGVSSNSVAFDTADCGTATVPVTGTSTNAPWDTNAPTLTILSPTDNEVFTNTAITVDGTASDANGIAGVTVNGAAASGTTNWTDAFTLSLGTNTITVIATDNSYNHNMATQIVHAIYAPTNHPPVIISPPVVTNALLQVDGLAVVIGGETNTFAVGAIDPDSDTLSYRWLFGDGVTNGWSPSNTAQHAYTTNCGPYTAGVSVSDGEATVSSNLTVAVACQLVISKMQVKLNFAKANADSASLTATNLDLGAGFGVTNKVVRVDIGGATNVVFTLDAKGKGVSGLGSCKLTYNKKTLRWALTAKLAKGSWQTAWAGYGLVNADVPKYTRTLVTMPVVVVIGTDAFAAEHMMFYTAKAGKSGKAK